MKKFLSLALVLALCISLSGCCVPLTLWTRATKTESPIQKVPIQDSDMTEMPTENMDIPEMTNPVEATVNLPHFENQPVEFAEEWLGKAGIAVETQYQFSNDVAEGCVISQSVPAGQDISVDAVLTLTVSKGPEACPYEYSQKLTVTAAAGSTQATAVLYQWEQGDWQEIAFYNAVIGKNGIGPAAEGSRRTPEGTYRLGVVLTANFVNTNMETRNVSANTCVVDDKNSPYYTMIMEKGEVPSGTSFDQIGQGLTNGTTYATIYIEHNGNGFSSENVVPGKGSAIGVRGRYGALAPTYGDVDIAYSDMIDLLSRLDISKQPVIEIFVK